MKLALRLLAVSVALAVITDAQAARQSKADREREERRERAAAARAKQQLEREVQKETDAALGEVRRMLSERGLTRPLVPEVLPTAPPEIKALISDAVKKRDAAIKHNIEQLKKYADSAVRARKSSPSRSQSASAKVEEIQSRIVTLYSTALPAFPSFPNASLKTGMIGTFKYAFRINQVQGDTDMLGERFWSVPRRVTRSINGRYEKGSVYTVVKPDDHTETIWVSGYPTGGLADGQSVKLEGVFRVSGTKTYTTVMGASRTVLTATPMNVEQYLKE